MIKATIISRGEKLSLRIEGHAEYAEEGKDIVCASASILANVVAYKVSLLARLGALKEPAIVKLESGDTEITCVPSDSVYHPLAGVYEFAGTGFCLLAHDYPQYVEVTGDEDD